jgi:hypothetical protein
MSRSPRTKLPAAGALTTRLRRVRTSTISTALWLLGWISQGLRDRVGAKSGSKNRNGSARPLRRPLPGRRTRWEAESIIGTPDAWRCDRDDFGSSGWASSQRMIFSLGKACFSSFSPASVTGVPQRWSSETLVIPFRCANPASVT